MLDSIFSTLSSFSAADAGWLGFIFIVAIGLILGSFLNVVIYRLPLMNERRDLIDASILLNTSVETPERINLLMPGSLCPVCQTHIPIHYNIPLVGYALLRGKCGSCKSAISIRYPIIEFTTTLLVVSTVYVSDNLLYACIDLIPILTLLALVGTDFERGVLPNQLTVPLIFAGLAMVALIPEYATFVQVSDSVIGIVLGFGSLALINAIYRKIRNRDGIGPGDYKLFAALGAWFGWMMLPVLLLVGSLGALAYTVTTSRKQGLDYNRAIPLGAFLALAGIAALLIRQTNLNIAWIPV